MAGEPHTGSAPVSYVRPLFNFFSAMACWCMNLALLWSVQLFSIYNYPSPRLGVFCFPVAT